jgi:hypothetical protein
MQAPRARPLILTFFFLLRFRISCQNAILLDFDAARETDVESRLWDAHLKVNNRFRKQLLRVSTSWTLLARTIY